MRKLTHNSGNKGLDTLLKYAHPYDLDYGDYGYEDVIAFLVLMDHLDVNTMDDILKS